jgi:NADH:ubiquinone oxidoreductase subunit C
MLNKLKNPLILFLILEKSKPILFTSAVNTSNTYFIYLNKNWFYLINIIFKKDLFFIKNFLLDCSAYNKLIIKNNIIIFYNYYFLNLKLKLNILMYTKNITSIDNLFNNLNWLERECSEMFGIVFLKKTDTRKLLLDYSIKENPMLKEYNSVNKDEYFYNYFNNQINFFNCYKLNK